MFKDSQIQEVENSKIVPKLFQYELLHKIRTVENYLLDYFGKGFLRGTTHTYLGQEAIAVSALSCLEDQDIVVSNHRSHGHFISYCNDYKMLLNEIVGSNEGVCRGLGGSQHLHYKNFFSNGILGGTLPVAVGMALAEKLKGNKAIVICFLGDGTMGEGIVYESLNMASLWKTPILFVIENNRYAQSTPVELNLAGSIAERTKAFNIETNEIESNDIGELLVCFEKAFNYIRKEGRPFCQIVNTYRMGPHSKGDDARSEADFCLWREKDPLKLAKKYFQVSDIEEIERIQEKEIKQYFETVFNKNNSNFTDSEDFYLETDDNLIPKDFEAKSGWIMAEENVLMVHHLQKTLQMLMKNYDQIYLLGEDLLDPYGGAFKVTKGLSSEFPQRVFSSPISEAGIVGVANGMALRGLSPIVEIMFGDFTTLIMDQIVNYATKFKRMYGGKVKCPIIIRTPVGGYKGYGPTHSQSLERLFFGVSGLVVIACDPVHDQGVIWERMFQMKSPCLYIENKTLYSQKLKPFIENKIEGFFVRSSESYFPITSLKIESFDTKTDIVLLAYGGMVPMAMNVAKKLYVEEEAVVEIVVPAQISPLPEEDLLQIVKSCKKVVVLEEGSKRSGWGAEIGALFVEKGNEKNTFRRCSALDTIIPNSKEGEAYVLPDEQSCYAILEEVLNVV